MVKIGYGFTKEERLCGELRIGELFRKGKSLVAYPLRVVWRCLDADEDLQQLVPLRVLISVPKRRLHRANQRNRAKRLMREAYRLQNHELWAIASEKELRLQLAFVWLADNTACYETVSDRMNKSLKKIADELCHDSQAKS